MSPAGLTREFVVKTTEEGIILFGLGPIIIPREGSKTRVMQLVGGQQVKGISYLCMIISYYSGLIRDKSSINTPGHMR